MYITIDIVKILNYIGHMPTPSQSRLPVEEEFFLAMTNGATLVQKLTETAIRTTGITVAEHTLLRIVQNTPGITAADARARLFATAPSTAQIVSSLEKKGCVTRVRDDIDTRKLHLFLTTTGKKAIAAGQKNVSALMKRVSIPPSLLQSLSGNLHSLISSLSLYAAE